MENYKIKVNDEAESKEAQELFFALGAHWGQSKTTSFKTDPMSFIYFNGSSIYYGHDDENDEDWFLSSSSGQELTLPQLRDLVAQSKSKVREYLDPNDNYKLCLINPSDAAHWMVEVPEGATLLTKDVGGYLTFWNGDLSMNMGECGWSSPEEDNGVLSFDEYKDYGYATLWSREQPQEQGLISGADALRALADGETVEVKRIHDSEWQPAQIFGVSVFTDSETTSFRINTKSTTLSLDLPAPMAKEPKNKAPYFYLRPDWENGFCETTWEGLPVDKKRFDNCIWSSKKDVQAVVAALRGIKG